ncbi:reticulon-like protein B17 [Panicum miliaceum]|uniref:Reticulon-like protein B17 n=1 Tax=Panicum miliaceum TaxID=4540 RepID=A0A3L6RH12_PANMI|nr:reticulon-like protein B17 [Panicum miliaceum]
MRGAADGTGVDESLEMVAVAGTPARARGAVRGARAGVPTKRAPGQAEAREGRRGGGGRRQEGPHEEVYQGGAIAESCSGRGQGGGGCCGERGGYELGSGPGLPRCYQRPISALCHLGVMILGLAFFKDSVPQRPQVERGRSFSVD